MPKFFVKKDEIKNNTVTITGGDSVHIAKVLRLSAGDALTLCDGCGTDYDAEIISCTKDEVVLNVLDSRLCPAEPNLSFVLFQGLPKQGKMDYIIEKCTELGISRIVPVSCTRSVVNVKDKQSEEKKLARWRKIAAESVKQCGRGIIPEITGIMSLKEAIAYAGSLDLTLAAYENERQMPLSQALKGKTPKTMGIFIGPEGGFADEEIRQFLDAGIETVTLGHRILRTETAGHTVLTAAMYEYGEMA